MKPFLSDRPRHDQPASPVETSAAHRGGLACLAGAARAGAVGQSGHTARASGSPSVECVREDGRVVRLVVTCACGERIEVDCQYDA